MKFSDAVFYFPFDWNGPVRRAFRAVQPDAIVILETEIWPNLLRYARSAGVPVVVVNGRRSVRAFRGVSGAVKISAGLLGGFLRQILNDAALYLVQSRQDAARLVALGAASDRVIVTGSMKNDLAEPQPNAFVNWLHGEVLQSRRGPLVVPGTIIAGEEMLVLEAFASIQHKWPQALLVLAPRKPDRFAMACEIAARAGWNAVRRSEISLDGLSAEILGAVRGEKTILVLDSMGELAGLYVIADAVFIGDGLH